MTAGRKHISLTKDWCTPPSVVSSVRRVFGGSIALDPCSNEHSLVKADKEYLLPDHDGLVESWDYPTIYVNPPMGRTQRAEPASPIGLLAWLRRRTQGLK